MAEESNEPALLDAQIEAEIEGGEQQQGTTQDTEPDGEPANTSGGAGATAGNIDEAQHEGPLEARIPAKKDASLREFLGKMDDYAPIVSLHTSYITHSFYLLHLL